MEASRANWNDDRLDRLADEVSAVRAQVDALGRQMIERFEKQEERMNDRFEKQEEKMTDRFERQDARINDRFDRLQTSLVVTLAGFVAAFTAVVVPTVF